jgi:hypothetical protein
MSKSLPKRSYLVGLKSLTLILDHNHEVLSTLVSCLLNSSPNLKDLRIIVSPGQLMHFFSILFFLLLAAHKMVLLCVTRSFGTREALHH